MPDPVTLAHGWWLLTQTGVHGDQCRRCRRSPGGPDHQPAEETRRA